MRIIPCLDVRDGRVVKGVKFAGLRDAGDPAERAAIYEEQGADELVILDVSATPEGAGPQVETVRRGARACWASRSPWAAACAGRTTRGACSTPAPTRWRSTPPPWTTPR